MTYVISDLVMGPETETFVKDLWSHLKRVSGDDKAYCCKDFLLLFKEETVLDLFIIILLFTPQCFYFVTYCVLDKDQCLNPLKSL